MGVVLQMVAMSTNSEPGGGEKTLPKEYWILFLK